MTAIGQGAKWRSLAACRSADPDLFFPVSSLGPSLEQVARAKSVCAACPVTRECLDFALATGQAHGVWGGASEQERERLRRPAPGAHAIRAMDRTRMPRSRL